MGPKSSKESPQLISSKNTLSKKERKEEEKLTKASFEFLQIIGRGGFGKVWKVYSRKYKTQYAMKEMAKTKIIDKRSEASIKSERDLLSIMNHSFIINMHFAFQDNANLYIAMDLLTGGDLRYQLCKQKRFDEEQTKFFMACIILSLEYCHTNNIIHRDVKPENLVFDDKGYLKLTDFGIAKFYQKENYRETSGTPGYMAPEVMCAQNHTIAVDYFALGVIGYEFMRGLRPYLGKSRKEIKEKVMAKQALIKKDDLPSNWSYESADFINRLLQRKPANRLGLRGAAEVKEHAWFKYYNWKELYLMTLPSPFMPKLGDNFDFKYCTTPDKIGVDTQERYYSIMNDSKYNNAFRDFYAFNRLKLTPNDELKAKMIINPHIIYIEEKAIMEEDMESNTSSMRQKSFVVKNRYGLENDKYVNLRRSPSALSSNVLLRGYKSAVSSHGSNSNTNSGTVNSKPSVEGLFRK